MEVNLNIRELCKDDVEGLVRIVDGAYPDSAEAREQRKKWFITELKERNAGTFYGAFDDSNEMIGIMALYDLRLNLRMVKIPAGGVGYVCTDFLHKKEKVAKNSILYFLRHYRQRGTNIVMLHPFNVPFYKKMGFGYGAKMHQFKVKPENFPRGDSKKNIRYVGEEYKKALLECFNRYVDRTNGMIEKRKIDVTNMFNKNNNIVAYIKDGKVSGYVVFHFRKAHPLYYDFHDMVVTELVYDTREALMEFCTFFNSQADQINRIVIDTPEDDTLFLLVDPSNGSKDAFYNLRPEMYETAAGPMYRVVNAEGIFKDLGCHNFGNLDMKLKITVKDSLLSENNGSRVVVFKNGLPEAAKDADFNVEITLDVSDFSSLIVGAIDFKTLYDFGLADISDTGKINDVTKLFAYDKKPKCTIFF